VQQHQHSCATINKKQLLLLDPTVAYAGASAQVSNQEQKAAAAS
jgi:hypothetical protein